MLFDFSFHFTHSIDDVRSDLDEAESARLTTLLDTFEKTNKYSMKIDGNCHTFFNDGVSCK